MAELQEELSEALHQNSNLIVEFVEGLDPEKIRVRPHDDRWSVLETLEHLVNTERGLLWIYRGEKRSETRDPAPRAELIKEKFLDFEASYHAPEPISPSGKYNELTEAISDFYKTRDQILEHGAWDQEYLAFEHRLFGTMTKPEWIHFCIVHGLRHLHQMETTYDQIK